MEQKEKQQGKLIVFSGGEKAGKSTQARLLAEHLEEAGIEVVLTREPGGTPEGGKIEAEVLAYNLNPKKELDFFLRDREIHFKEKVLPALEEGKWVVTDRCSPETIAYQHYGRGLDLEDIKKRDEAVRQGRDFDLVILIDVDPWDALKRDGVRTRFEKENFSFHDKVREGFLKQAKENPEKWLVVDGRKSKEEITEIIWEEVKKRFLEN